MRKIRVRLEAGWVDVESALQLRAGLVELALHKAVNNGKGRGPSARWTLTEVTSGFAVGTFAGRDLALRFSRAFARGLRADAALCAEFRDMVAAAAIKGAPVPVSPGLRALFDAAKATIVEPVEPEPEPEVVLPDTGELHCAVCCEPWHPVGVLSHADMAAEDAAQLLDGRGCPCCKGQSDDPQRLAIARRTFCRDVLVGAVCEGAGEAAALRIIAEDQGQ